MIQCTQAERLIRRLTCAAEDTHLKLQIRLADRRPKIVTMHPGTCRFQLT